MAKSREPLLQQQQPPKTSQLARTLSRADDELVSFRSCLRWSCVDQTTTPRALLSWSLFFLLAVAVPAVSHFVLSYSERRRPYDSVVQLSLSAGASLSFVCLSASLRRYGLRRFLFLDKLQMESRRVQVGYAAQLRRSLWMLACCVLPSFLAECGYKVWWYCSGARRIPFLGNEIASDSVACALELASWIYRTTMFFLVCVLFRLICYLQILRLQDFAMVFQEESEVAAVLSEHLRIRRQLMVISHRFRRFIVAGLVLVTATQLAALLLTTRSHAEVNLFNTGEMALSSLGLVAGLLICLRSAAKITHKAQALTSHAAKWHVCATIESFEADPETPCEAAAASNRVFSVIDVENQEEFDGEEAGDAEEDELEGTKLVHPHANTICFQKRQALVTYLENNRAGITIFGFVLDRGYLHMVFMIQLSLVLWLLGKTIGIS
ncbi:uncharacterized protein M6B38_126270 [Iris pallida]|uniref:Gustatory receptor n=1 Tax=Iris pallida TaxID=29817 RepID=A0AAX6GMS1_IRIPA|nr:uncharacterized protein M6B38_126270 [Iris pallida]